MKKIIIKIALFFVFLLLISCSTMQYNINKNNKFTERQTKYLLQKNGNAFYLSSTYALFSTIWTYCTDKIEVYKLAKGKVIKKETFWIKNTMQFNAFVFNDIENELYQKCALNLDGDCFGFRIYKDGIICKENYPIDINCLQKETYESDFLNKIASDIKTYKLWEVKYK